MGSFWCAFHVPIMERAIAGYQKIRGLKKGTIIVPLSSTLLTSAKAGLQEKENADRTWPWAAGPGLGNWSKRTLAGLDRTGFVTLQHGMALVTLVWPLIL